MSHRHFDLASSDKCLLIGSAFLLALIGMVLSRDAEVAASPAAMLAPALPIAATTGGVVMVPGMQQISSDSLAPSWGDSSRKVSWVF